MRVIKIGVALILMASAAYWVQQDISVRQQFEGRKWALPARVYAAPTELYPGAPIGGDRLEGLLHALQYREDAALSSQGAYLRQNGIFRMKSRAFQFADKMEPPRLLELRFERDQLVSITDLEAGRALPIFRMEPIQIGSFYPSRKEDRILIKLDQVPPVLLQALFSIEDRHFYAHSGISGRGILRALWVNARAGAIVQGGSTLTQQLVKNLFLTAERTLWRKINEVTMALILDARYSKEEILEAYLNEIYLGQDGARAIHGFGLASRYYFGRSIEELQLHQLALLVGLVRAPSHYDPWHSPKAAAERRGVVLATMVETGAISSADAESARSKPLDVVANAHQAISPYPAFVDLVKRQLLKHYDAEDLTSEGLRIFTTLEVEAQQHLESAAATTLQRLSRQTHKAGLETAAIVTRRETGDIVALIGSRDPGSTGFNRALDAERQIGSLIKPVVYLAALQQPARYTLATPLQDTAVRLDTAGHAGPWVPKNYDGREHGEVPLHRALAQSYNLATIRLGMRVGIERTVETLRQLGVDVTEVQPLPSLLLGAVTLTPLEVSQLYQTLASDGFLTPLTAIRAVTTAGGKILSRYGLTVKQAVDPSAVFLVNTILQEAVAGGTGQAAYSFLPRDFAVAGKTGTSNDLRDSWFAGFTGDYLGVAWVGRDDNRSTGLTGAQGALRIWALTMQRIAQQAVVLIPPDNIERVWIDHRTGLRADERCANTVLTPFIAGSAPTGVTDCAGNAYRAVKADDLGDPGRGKF